MKSTAWAYLIWSIFLISTGFYIMHKMADLSNPYSLSSNFKNINETIDDADSEIP